jgi:hypothetical protein
MEKMPAYPMMKLSVTASVAFTQTRMARLTR